MATVNEKMTALADEIRTLSGDEGKLGLDAMATHVGDANTEINGQAQLLAQISAALEGKMAGGGSGSGNANVNTHAIEIVNTSGNSCSLYGSLIDADGNLVIFDGHSMKENSSITINGIDNTIFVFHTLDIEDTFRIKCNGDSVTYTSYSHMGFVQIANNTTRIEIAKAGGLDL